MNHEPLISLESLLKQGYAIYKQNLHTILGLSSLYVAFIFMGLAAFLGSLVLLLAFASLMGVIGFALMTLFALVVVVFFVWILVRVLLALLYAIRNHENRPSIFDSLAEGRGRSRDFLWLMILTALVVVGSLVCILILDLIILFPFSYVHSSALELLAILIVYVGSIVGLLVISSWFAFSTWLFIDSHEKGLHALALSMHLSHKMLGSIMWRLFCIAFLYGIAAFIIELVLNLIFSVFVPYDGFFLAVLLTKIIVALTLLPILYGSMFSLYKSVKTTHHIDRESRAHGEHRGVLIALATLGFLVICAFPAFIHMLQMQQTNTYRGNAYSTNMYHQNTMHAAPQGYQ
jgi:hypothetical protein